MRAHSNDMPITIRPDVYRDALTLLMKRGRVPHAIYHQHGSSEQILECLYGSFHDMTVLMDEISRGQCSATLDLQNSSTTDTAASFLVDIYGQQWEQIKVWCLSDRVIAHVHPQNYQRLSTRTLDIHTVERGILQNGENHNRFFQKRVIMEVV